MKSVPLVKSAAKSGIDVDAALEEIKSKSESEIESETSYKWASRAIAAYKLYKETEKLEWLLRAEDTRHEALEHGALADDGVLDEVREEMDKYRPGLKYE